MKLSESQIQQLHTFTQKHYVEWYDVQIELVDHLANGIENQWENNPDLNFENALNNEFKKFGIFGFSTLVEEKTNALNKHYRKQVWFYFKQFFKLPKILITFFLIWTLSKIIKYFDYHEYLLVAIVVLLFSSYLYYLIKTKRATNLINKRTGKKWLFENTLLQFGGLIYVMNIGAYLPTILEPNRQWHTISELIFSTFVVLFALVFYINIKIVSPKIKAKASQEYSEYNVT